MCEITGEIAPTDGAAGRMGEVSLTAAGERAAVGSGSSGFDVRAAAMPMTVLVATASIACILAVAAAAATAAAVGMEELGLGPISAFGGVIARPTLNCQVEKLINYLADLTSKISYRNNCPPKSNKFMLAIASSAACLVAYSMNP